MQAFYGQIVKNDLDFKQEGKTEKWMETQDDVRLGDYLKQQNGCFSLKNIQVLRELIRG